MMDTFLFAVWPWLAVGVAVTGTVARLVWRPASRTSRSSQFLEGRALYWGSVPFHWGILLLLVVHLAALAAPWAGRRLWVLEVTGFALGLWTVGGLVVLLVRRIANPMVRATTRPMDLLVVVLLLVQAATGVAIAHAHGWGFGWMRPVAGPWLWSLVTLRPDPSTVAPLPWLVKLHFANAFLLLALLPFSRLIHLLSVPLGYLSRPAQVVAWGARCEEVRRA